MMIMSDIFIVIGIVIVLVIVLLLVIDAIYDNYYRRKREKALAYPLRVTEQVYFYGRSAADCMKKNAINELRWNRIGDFSLIFGELVLFALSADRNNDARIHYKLQPPDGDLLPEHYSVIITFKYDGKRWMVRLRGCLLDDGASFYRTDEPVDRSYTTWAFPGDIPRHHRYLVSGCTDPDHSYLEPNLPYSNLKGDALRDKIEEILQRIGL